MDIQGMLESMESRGCTTLADILGDFYKKRRKSSHQGASQEDASVREDEIRTIVEKEYFGNLEEIAVSIDSHPSDETHPVMVTCSDEVVVQVDFVKLKVLSTKEDGLQEALTSFPSTVITALLQLLNTTSVNIKRPSLVAFFNLCKELQLDTVVKSMQNALKSAIPGAESGALWIQLKDTALSEVITKCLLEKCYIYASLINTFIPGLPLNLFLILIDHDELRVSSEDDVIDLILQFKVSSTAENVKRAISCIRFPFLSVERFNNLHETLPEVESCTEYVLVSKSTKWLSRLPEKQLKRRKFYSHHLHLLWHEDSVLDDSERLGVSCLYQGNIKELCEATISEDLRSTVEARGRCAILNRKVYCAADLDGYLWTWQLNISNNICLSKVNEVRLDKAFKEIEVVDLITTEEGISQVSWRDLENSVMKTGLLKNSKGDHLPRFQQLQIPASKGSKRCQHFGDTAVIMCKDHLVAFNKKSSTSKKFPSPAGCSSNFLDILVVQDKCYVYDFQMVTTQDGASGDGIYKDVLQIFHFDELRWDSEPWDIDLGTKNVERRLYTDAFNGVTLFLYRKELWNLIEVGENFDFKHLVHLVDEEEGFYERVSELKGVSEDGSRLREFLGVVPADLTYCSTRTKFLEYCSTHNDDDLHRLRLMAE